jgi:hypothetical protein
MPKRAQASTNAPPAVYPHARQAAGWGYGDLGEPADLTGVPILEHNFKDPFAKK